MMTDSEQLNRLRAYLDQVQPGPIGDSSTLEPLLAASWHEFDGNDSEGIEGYKLHGRMEDITWKPPVLEFSIERHGQTCCGSSRATVHRLAVHLDEKDIIYVGSRLRQLYAMKPRLNVKPLVEEVVGLVVARQEHDWLKWNEDGRVRVLAGKIIPEHSVCKQTLQGRRKRFRDVLLARLLIEGWSSAGGDYYTFQKSK